MPQVCHTSEREPAGDGDRCQTVRRRSVPQLAGAVVRPAICGAARRDPAGVRSDYIVARFGAHRCEREPAGHGDRMMAAGGQMDTSGCGVGCGRREAQGGRFRFSDVASAPHP